VTLGQPVPSGFVLPPILEEHLCRLHLAREKPCHLSRRTDPPVAWPRPFFIHHQDSRPKWCRSPYISSPSLTRRQASEKFFPASFHKYIWHSVTLICSALEEHLLALYVPTQSQWPRPVQPIPIHFCYLHHIYELECGPMPNLMVALPNIGGALCSTPQSLADPHY